MNIVFSTLPQMRPKIANRAKSGLKVLFMLIACLLLTAGCMTMSAGYDFPDELVKNIEIGLTTKDEIRSVFGEPWRVGLENGNETWTYGKYRYSGTTETSAKDLVVRFTKNDIVESYTFSKTNR